MGAAVREQPVRIPLDEVVHNGDLGVPHGARGLVIFAHGSGSSRLSRRNRYVAGKLQHAGLATLLFDLLTEAEDRDDANRFNIELLKHRLLGATAWAQAQQATGALGLGYFGASTGAAAALMAAAVLDGVVRAVVSRGGRPDLAREVLARVRAPTLLIVGGEDHGVIDLNRQAYEQLLTVKALEVVPGATHLFEEPGALEEVARLATAWFLRYLGG
jgi:putative phosphoribosyl transferase